MLRFKTVVLSVTDLCILQCTALGAESFVRNSNTEMLQVVVPFYIVIYFYQELVVT